MTKKKKTSQNGFATNWKNLAPKSSRRPASRAAFRKRMLFLSKIFILLVVLASVGAGVWLLHKRTSIDSGPFDLTGPGLAISKVSFSSDGVLRPDWFKNWFGPLRNRTLMDIDIVQLQKDLLNEKQISFARVSRIFPDTLKIEVSEKVPVLRLCLRTKLKGEETWIVGTDGSLYLGSGYGAPSLAHLPFLKINPKFLIPLPNEEGYRNLQDIPKIAPLLDLARREFPGLYQDWQIVSYERPNDNDPGAHIMIKSRKVKKLRFSPNNYAQQLRRLKYLLTEPDFRRTPLVESIDLSHDRSVFAKLSPS